MFLLANVEYTHLKLFVFLQARHHVGHHPLFDLHILLAPQLMVEDGVAQGFGIEAEQAIAAGIAVVAEKAV